MRGRGFFSDGFHLLENVQVIWTPRVVNGTDPTKVKRICGGRIDDNGDNGSLHGSGLDKDGDAVGRAGGVLNRNRSGSDNRTGHVSVGESERTGENGALRRVEGEGGGAAVGSQ